MSIPRYRWSDNQTQRWRFVFCKGDWKKYSFVLDTGDEEEDGKSIATIRLALSSYTIIFILPSWLSPPAYKEKVTPIVPWDAETIERLGRDYYYQTHSRKWGFSCSEGFLQIFYGTQNDGGWDVSSRSKSYNLPWKQWRHIRRSWHYLDGQLHHSEYGTGFIGEPSDLHKMVFAFNDYDGECITATTHIEEREWRRGEGYFKWLSFFYKPIIRRTLEISFSKEVGRRKGSWKGGTIGHSIDMLENELPYDAFLRYAEEHEFTNVKLEED